MATVSLDAGALARSGAVAYACSRLGFRVIPLRRDTGTPAFTEWPERATREVEQIRAWWTGEYAGHPVGIATGEASGVWVLDVDVKHGDGFAELRELCAQHQTGTEPFERTMVVATPSGGAHIYFRWDDVASREDGVVNSAKRLGPNLDVRGRSGYVRAPGQIGYVIVPRGGVQHVDMIAAPVWLTELCKRRRASGFEAVSNADIRARLAEGGAARVRFEQSEALRRLERAEAGSRNDMLNRTAFKLGRLSRLTGQVDEATARNACLAAMQGAGARDTVAQQERTFRSGWESGQAAAAPQPGPDTADKAAPAVGHR